MEIIRDIEQGTEEWLALRYGWTTASRFKDVMAKGAGRDVGFKCEECGYWYCPKCCNVKGLFSSAGKCPRCGCKCRMGD